jgi:general secretion pathway protein J
MHARNQAGFSLLEVMVALVVLGLLMAGVSQGLRLGVDTWRAQIRNLSTGGDLEAAEGMLRAFVARMDPGGVSGQPSTMRGSARGLAFTTTLPQSAGALPTLEADVSLFIDDANRLQLLWLPHIRNRTRPPPPPERSMLLGDVDHLELAYWNDSSAGWQTEWAAPPLPRLIRIRIVFSRASGRHGPDIVLAPMRDPWRL